MTEVVVTDKGNTVVIDTTSTRVITSGMIPPISASSIKGSVDTDLTNLQDGGILVYNSESEKWVATNLLNSQILEAGQF